MINSKRNRQERRRRPEPYSPEDWWERRRQGFGMNLYRNTRDQKIAGVCAGLADHFNVDHWVVRLIAVGGIFFFNMLMVWAYLAAWVAMAPRPKGMSVQQRFRYDENLHQDRPVNMFRYQGSASDRLVTAKQRMEEVVERVGKMERYVTSRRFELDREFSKIQD